ncbi:MAG: 2-C-methyl-D-erythritol 4-phosphate cytidylyltransferase [Bacteriovoracaceae bacterium]|nr:2-C-methyl-D-erythritol 4-phosphate cytidylyltransferase [Bacteriovoracaceae bacterium]
MVLDLSAVVVAAGRGLRFQKTSNSAQSKQLLEWGGKPLFVHTLEALSELSLSEIILVIRAEEEAQIHRHLEAYSLNQPIKISFGGERRQDSVRLGLEKISSCNRVLIHDGARPNLSASFLRRLDEASKNHDCLIPVLPVVETLKEINAAGEVVRTHDRSKFVRVQTPQFFKFSKIKDAHEKLKDSKIEFTDDAAMFEHLGFKVQTCEGSLENIKVTVFEDIKERVLNAR